LNGTALTCKKLYFRRSAHYAVLGSHLWALPTDLNRVEPQVNGREQPCREPLFRMSSSYFWEQVGTILVRTPTNIRLC
jgi:hypothetical protein